jgi:hypothetical protein
MHPKRPHKVSSTKAYTNLSPTLLANQYGLQAVAAAGMLNPYSAGMIGQDLYPSINLPNPGDLSNYKFN